MQHREAAEGLGFDTGLSRARGLGHRRTIGVERLGDRARALVRPGLT
jgi:hypothetical protein